MSVSELKEGSDGRGWTDLVLVDVPAVPLVVPARVGLLSLDDVSDVDVLKACRQSLDEQLREGGLARSRRSGDDDVGERHVG